MGKRIVLAVIFLFAAGCVSLSAQDKEYTIYCIGSEYSGQSIAFQKDMESRPEIKALFAPYNYEYIDKDELPTSDPKSKYLVLAGGGVTLPLFVGVNGNGDIVFMHQGYNADELTGKLTYEAVSQSGVLIAADQVATYRYVRRENLHFIARLQYSRWKLGGEIGANLYNIASSDLYDGYKFGYEGRAYARYYLSNRYSMDMGVMFNSIGGHDPSSKNKLRLNYIGIPVDFTRLVYNHYPQWHISAGFYGAHRVGQHLDGSSDIPALEKWDAGIRLGLDAQFGSFRAYARYTRGLINVFPSSMQYKGYNNGFSIGISVNLGE